MAEHYQDELLQQGANLVVGPDSYKQLPYLIESLDVCIGCVRNGIDNIELHFIGFLFQ